MGLLDRLAKRAAAQAAPPSPARPAPRRAAPAMQQSAPTQPSIDVEALQAQYAAELDALRVATEQERQRAARYEKQAKDLAAAKQQAELAARAERIRYNTMQLAAKHGAIDAEDVAELLARRVTLDATGALVDASDASKTGDDVVKTFLETKPHLARPQVSSGSGAAPPAGKLPTPPHDRKLNAQDAMRAAVEMLTQKPS